MRTAHANFQPLTSIQESAFFWHLQSNISPSINHATQTDILKDINNVRTGKRALSDLLPDMETTIKDMIIDLHLEDFIPENCF